MDIEQKIKTKLLIRGFSKNTLLNNRGLIGATTDETILEVVKNLGIANVMCSFTVEDLQEAFEAGRTVSNYKGEWQETYSDDYTSAKYEKFEDWLKNYA